MLSVLYIAAFNEPRAFPIADLDSLLSTLDSFLLYDCVGGTQLLTLILRIT